MKSSTIPLFGQQAAAPRVPKTTTELVGPTLARHLRDTANFSRQRVISPKNVERLAAEMRAGRFTPGTQIYICVLPDGQQLIINGNHTLEAVALSGCPQFLAVTRHPVNSEDEAGEIYAVFDTQKTRSWADSLRAVAVAPDIPMPTVLLAALGVIEERFGSGNPGVTSRHGRIAKMEVYGKAMKAWHESILGAPGPNVMLLRRAPVLAVALETFNGQPDAAHTFWHSVSHDDMLPAKSPQKALLTWLRGQRGAGGGAARKEHSHATAAAWNAYFRNEERSFIQPRAMTAFYLLGTRFSAGVGR